MMKYSSSSYCVNGVIHIPGASSRRHRLEPPPSQSQHSWSFCPTCRHFSGSHNDPPPSGSKYNAMEKCGSYQVVQSIPLCVWYIRQNNSIRQAFCVILQWENGLRASLLFNYKYPPLRRRHSNKQIKTGLHCPLNKVQHPALLPPFFFLQSHCYMNNIKGLCF